jgi:hypothetical protein
VDTRREGNISQQVEENGKKNTDILVYAVFVFRGIVPVADLGKR